MEKRIAAIRFRMIALVVMIGALAAWQNEFILAGINAHVYLTSSILLTFGFGIVMAFVFVMRLGNEVAAFQALRETWDDILVSPAQKLRDPLWRHRRCMKPARVFRRPKILGHAYDLVIEDLARTKEVSISVDTMNNIVDKIDQTIETERSLVVYLSGLLVFMGLIGTFTGLLHMVGGISNILGSLAQTAGSSAASSEAFQKMLYALQDPLNGMALGFASSLFGLTGSLVVSLLGRFAGQAAAVLRGEFEAWLAGVAQLSDGAKARAVRSSSGRSNDQTMLRMITGVLADYARVAGSFELTARSLQDMRKAQGEHDELLQRIATEFISMQGIQAKLAEQVNAVSHIAPAIHDLRVGLDGLADNIGRRLDVDVASLREMLVEMERSHSGSLRLLSSTQLQASTQMASAIEMLSADIERRTAAPPASIIEAAVEKSVRMSLDEVGRLLSINLDRSNAWSREHLSKQDLVVGELTRFVEKHGGDSGTEKMAKALEQVMTDGFDRVGRNIEATFSAYSSLFQVALGALERAGHLAKEGELPIEVTEATPERSNLEQLLDELRNRSPIGTVQ